MMTNADRILAAVMAQPGLTDAELGRSSGVEPHQQVNEICRRLEAEGLLRRVRGSAGRIVNLPWGGVTASSDHCTSTLAGAVATAKPKPSQASLSTDAGMPGAQEALIVVPCSGRKSRGRVSQAPGPSILDLLPVELARSLRRARSAVAGSAHLDESLLLPAWRRYAGSLYQTCGTSLSAAAAVGVPAMIISGGYGIVLTTEPIGWYDHLFARRDWPTGLLEDCLVAMAEQAGVHHVVAFCARTTGYAELLRRVRWASHEIEAILVTPVTSGRGGAQILVPRASGEALTAFLAGRLVPGWVSSDGVAVETGRMT